MPFQLFQIEYFLFFFLPYRRVEKEILRLQQRAVAQNHSTLYGVLQLAHIAGPVVFAQAALLFNEAIEALEEGYAGTAFKENELAQYYREAEDYLSRCSEGKPLKARQSSPQNTQQGKAAARSKPRSAQQTRSTKNTAARSRSTGTKQSRGTASRSKKQQTGGESKAALGIILAVLVLGLIARAISMGLV